MKSFFVLLVVLFGIRHQVRCLEGEGSLYKYFKNYRANEYNNNQQNWCITQDKRGIIYAANQGGVLEFDGHSWHSFDIPNQSVYSLAVDDNGTLFIGGINEIGIMAADATGSLQYNSLKKHLKGNPKIFGNVWATHIVKGGVFFQASHYLFRWQGGKLKVFASGGMRFHTSFTCRGELFVRQDNVGLIHVVKNSLQLVPKGERFASEKVYLITPYDDRKVLIGTRSGGFFLFDGTNLEPFYTQADRYVKEKQLYHGIGLKSSPGQFALGTRQGGLVIVDGCGKLKAIFNTTNLLPDRGVTHVFEDFQGNLWLALNRGISKIEYNSPLSLYNEQSGLPGMVLSVEKHDNTLYVGTYNGLFSLKSDGKFHNVSGIVSPCWSLLTAGKFLLVAATHGLLQIEKDVQKKILDSYSYVLLQSKRDLRRVWVGTRNGLASLYLTPEKQAGQWLVEHKFKEINEEIRTLAEDRKGNLWIGPRAKDVLKIDFRGGETANPPAVTRYGASHGLPELEVRIFKAAGHIIFATDEGLYRFKEEKQAFVPDSILGHQFTGIKDGKIVFRMAEDRSGNIWLHSDRRNIQAIPQPDGSFIINKKPFLRLPPGQANAIYPDPDGNIIWFATNDGLIRYDNRIKKNYHLNFSAVIRQVLINGKLIFNGHQSKQPFPIIDFKNRNLRFQFAAPFFEGESETRYRTFLEGYEDKWSEWTSEPQKEYTNLNSGSYTFRVQAKNVYEHLSRKAAFQFKVLPPWYKTWWAFLIYTFLFFLLMYFIVKWRSGKLRREKQKLEQIVKERTKEINEKNLQLESQTVQLKEQSEKLKELDKVKSRFFANISHEFRTPLTLLIGPLEQMIADCSDDEKEKRRKLTMMLRNAQRLLRLINQLLELSKLDSGKMKLQAVNTDIISFVKGIVDSFRFMAHQKEMELLFETGSEKEAECIMVYIDPRKMEDLMSNLLINAVKFTPPGGEIKVKINKSFPLPTGGEIKNFVEISVSDTGPGIPSNQLTHIFDRFFQADSTHEHHQKGSGIGLALCKELVELHHGTIEARNREVGGSEFIIRLPMGSAHLAPDEQSVSADVKSAPPDAEVEEAGSEITEETIPLGMQIEKEEENEKGPGTGYDFDAEAIDNETGIILVVEDSADLRDYIRGALEPGYTVEDAKDGREGIQKAQEIIPDLIISDVMMPEVDGYELCRVLKNDVNTSHVPIIMLTAKASEENILQGLETGADDYITKPFSTKILIARIKNLIDIRRQLQKNINREMTLQPVKTSVSEIDREFLRDLHDVIKANLSDPEFNVEELCRRLYMGRTTLYRKIQALSGLTPTDFIRSYRLKRGAELLKQNFGSVLEVAFEVGFNNASYFAKCFKEKFHQLPSQYQAANK